MFDLTPGRIGILPDRQGFAVLEAGRIRVVENPSALRGIRGEYIEHRNHLCDFQIKVRLGYVPSLRHSALRRFGGAGPA
jgi:hypothetical protein